MTNIENLLNRADEFVDRLSPAVFDTSALIRDLAAAVRELLLARRALCVRLDELEEERDQLRADYRELQEENAMIQGESAERKRERDLFREENNRLRMSSKFDEKLDIVDQLRAENADMKSGIEIREKQWKTNYEHLERESDQLSAENSWFKNENSLLKKERDNAGIAADLYREENARLKEENEVLKALSGEPAADYSTTVTTAGELPPTALEEAEKLLDEAEVVLKRTMTSTPAASGTHDMLAKLRTRKEGKA